MSPEEPFNLLSHIVLNILTVILMVHVELKFMSYEDTNNFLRLLKR